MVMEMAIEVLKKINEKDACSRILHNPQRLCIVNIDDIKESTKKKNQYYCYIDFEMEDGTQFGASYSFYKENGLFKCGTSSKLFYLMKGFLDLNELECVGLTFDKSDIDETLLNKKFNASAFVQNVGNEKYIYLMCEMVVE